MVLVVYWNMFTYRVEHGCNTGTVLLFRFFHVAWRSTGKHGDGSPASIFLPYCLFLVILRLGNYLAGYINMLLN